MFTLTRAVPVICARRAYKNMCNLTTRVASLTCRAVHFVCNWMGWDGMGTSDARDSFAPLPAVARWSEERQRRSLENARRAASWDAAAIFEMRWTMAYGA